MADRYSYIPLLGIFVMVVWSAADWADSRQINLQMRATVAVLILGVLSFLTWRQIGYWRSEYDLWSHDLEVAPDNPLAISNLGDALNKMGRPKKQYRFSKNPRNLFRGIPSGMETSL